MLSNPNNSRRDVAASANFSMRKALGLVRRDHVQVLADKAAG